MLKRPLVWILGAYLAGMCLAYLKVTTIFSMFLIVILCIFLIYFTFFSKTHCLPRSDRFLWFLPILIMIGYLAMGEQLKLPELYQAFEQKVDCELSGNIQMIVKRQKGTTLYVKNNTVILPNGDRYLCEKVILYCEDEVNYLVGNQILVKGTLQKFSKATNPGQFNEQLYYQIENVDFKLKANKITITDSHYLKYQAILGKLKSKLIMVYANILGDKESGAIIAMLLGEKYLLEDEIKELYQENGISHVLAISGLHVSLIGMFVFTLLKKLRVPIVIATFLSIFFIYSYGVLTNFSVSTNRAVVMMVVMLLSTLIGKTYDMLSALSLSALLILLQNPLQIMSAGFLLSFGAVLGIAIILPCLQQLFPTQNVILKSIYLSLSAQVTTMPLVIFFFYQFPTYSLIINLIILPFVTLLTLSSILAGLVGMIYLPFGVFLIGGTNYILKFYEWVCRVGDRLWGNLITIGKPSDLQLIFYTVVLIVFVYGVRKYNKKYMCAALLLAIIILLIPHKNMGLVINMLDVGQGDCSLIESNNGTTYLIDGGSSNISKVGTYRITPFLLSQGIDTIDYVMISHSDQDHCNGVIELMEKGKIKIKNLILPLIIEKEEAYLQLETLAKENGISLNYITAGDSMIEGDLQIHCLNPQRQQVYRSSNAYSTVLSVSYGDFMMLFTGDLEGEGEALVTQLLRSGSFLEEANSKVKIDYDILKIAHHGSKNSTKEELLDIVRPELSIISCGENNRYGHPHKELLERLGEVHSEIKITYESGAICMKTDGKRLLIKDYNQKYKSQ